MELFDLSRLRLSRPHEVVAGAEKEAFGGTSEESMTRVAVGGL